MDTRFHKILGVAAILLSSQMCLGASNPWADEVVSFSQPDGSSTTGGLPSAALGAPDMAFVSIDEPEELILAFIDNRVADGPGDDLWVYGAGTTSSVNVFGRTSDGPCTFLGTVFAEGGGFDLADYPGLDYLDFIRFVGLDNDGQFQGYDLDAVQALNGVVRNPSCSVPAPAAVLLTSLGAGAIAAMRRRRML